MSDPPPLQPPAGPVTPWSEFINRQLVAVIIVALLAFTLAYQWRLVANLSSPDLVVSGLYDTEGRTTVTPYRWTNGDAHVWFGGIGKQSYRLTLTLSSARPAGLDLPTVTLLADGTQIASFKAPRPLRDSTFEIPSDAVSASGDLDLNIQSDTFAPPNDLRSLGVAVYALQIESDTGQAPQAFPASGPVVLGSLAISLTFLALNARLPRRASWMISLLLLIVLSVGLALWRTQSVAVLPWAVLISVIAFISPRPKNIPKA